MTQQANPPVANNYFLEPGFIYLASEPTAVSTVLGSSVAVCLHDRQRKLGGINHYQYPATREPQEATARYGNVATLALIRMLVGNGSVVKDLQAQILGGACNDGMSPDGIGDENIRVARKILNKKRIPIVSEDVGGQIGRKVVFKTDTNETMVIKVENIRADDWFPYESKR